MKDVIGGKRHPVAPLDGAAWPEEGCSFCPTSVHLGEKNEVSLKFAQVLRASLPWRKGPGKEGTCFYCLLHPGKG